MPSSAAYWPPTRRSSCQNHSLSSSLDGIAYEECRRSGHRILGEALRVPNQPQQEVVGLHKQRRIRGGHRFSISNASRGGRPCTPLQRQSSENRETEVNDRHARPQPPTPPEPANGNQVLISVAIPKPVGAHAFDGMPIQTTTRCSMAARSLTLPAELRHRQRQRRPRETITSVRLSSLTACQAGKPDLHRDVRGDHQHPVRIATGQARHRRVCVLFQRTLEFHTRTRSHLRRVSRRASDSVAFVTDGH